MRGYVGLLLTVSGVWGSTFMFIELALEGFGPASMMAAQALLSGSVLLGLLAARSGARGALEELRAVGRHGVVVGLLHIALPFLAVAWGQTHVDSGVAAIVTASIPVITIVLAIRLRPSERVRGIRLAGIVLGLGGVALLAGAQPDGGGWALAGIGAIALAAVSASLGTFYVQTHVAGIGGLPLATGAALGSTVLLLPLGAIQLADVDPSSRALVGVAGLSLIGSIVGRLLFYRLIELHGSTRASLVNYVIPCLALVYGAVLLGEPVTGGKLGGLALVLAGVALGSGGRLLPPRLSGARARRRGSGRRSPGAA